MEQELRGELMNCLIEIVRELDREIQKYMQSRAEIAVILEDHFGLDVDAEQEAKE